MTDAWEMHQAETGLNPGPVWRDRGVIIANLTRELERLKDARDGWMDTLEQWEARCAELEGSCQKLRDDYQGALAEAGRLAGWVTFWCDKVRAAESLADEWQEACDSGSNGRHGYHCSEYGDHYATDLRAALASEHYDPR